MESRTHYDALGISRSASADEVRSAHRKLVLKHHPDRSSDPKSAAIFLEVSEAYQILGDYEKRRDYDRLLAVREQHGRMQQATPKPRPQPTQPQPPRPPNQPRPQQRIASPDALREDLKKLNHFFSRGQYAEAEALARSILSRDARQAVPYGMLGDIARARGNPVEAARMYAFAVQMDPRNPLYQRRHEELLGQTKVTTSTHRIGAKEDVRLAPVLVGLTVVLLGCIYLALSRERPLLPELSLVSTWTLGLLGVLFFSGVAIGSSFSLAGLLDRFQSITVNSTGRASPTVTLGVIAVINFWAAAVLYSLIGIAGSSFNFSTSRVVAAVAGTTLFITAFSAASYALDALQVLIWGGNVVYIGALCGWMVADAFRA